jgi:hypothetical protein
MPYLGLHGMGLVVAITVSSGMGFILFGKPLESRFSASC